MKKKLFRRDALVALCALALSIGALAVFSFLRQDGAYAVVLVDGEERLRRPLVRDTVVEIATEYGRNTLKIEDGKASVTHADCADGICAAHSPVRHAGESIVCLPHRMVVEIRDE